MKRTYLAPLLCIVCGLIVLAGSVALPHLIPPGPDWTPEKASEYEQTAEELRRLSIEAASDAEPELAAVRRRYDVLRNQLNQSRGGTVLVGMVLQMLGVGLGLVGSVWLILRQNQAEDQARSA